MTSQPVFPAHAGVIRNPIQSRPVCTRLPRACGGDPSMLVIPRTDCTSSPRMRG